MRKTTGTLLLAIISVFVFAQNEKQDVIHFKNGTIIKGDIVELKPGDIVRIDTGKVLDFEMEKVKKIVRDTKKSKDKEEESIRDGFIGISFGSSYPVSEYADDSPDNSKAGYASNGITINLLNLGYQFHPNMGIGLKWFGSGHLNQEYEDEDNIWSNGGILIGPLLVIPMRDIMSLELKPMIGTGATILDKEDGNNLEGFGTSYHLGANLRFDIHNRWRITGGINYTSLNPDFENADRELNVNTLDVNVGIGYLFD